MTLRELLKYWRMRTAYTQLDVDKLLSMTPGSTEDAEKNGVVCNLDLIRRANIYSVDAEEFFESLHYADLDNEKLTLNP